MHKARSYKHCKACGAEVRYQTPANDNRERAICPSCAAIHYENPINVVGTLPLWQGHEVLLCRRNIEPRFGFWTLPAGFLEWGESTAEGAARETIEEAGAEFELQNLFTVINVIQAGQLHLYYRAKLIHNRFAPGPETIEAKLFKPEEIPWDELAFKTVRVTLEKFVAQSLEERVGGLAVHCLDV